MASSKRRKFLFAETPLNLNITRLKASILGESVTVVKPLFFWGRIALLGLTANKRPDNSLFFTMRVEYPDSINTNINFEELQKQIAQDTEYLLDKDGVMRTNYELQESEYSEEKIFKFVRKLSNAHLDVVPYEGLISDHMEYLLSKILSSAISICPREAQKCHQPILTKETQSINQPMEVTLGDVDLTIKLTQKAGTTFYLNLVGENHFIRSHVYMDKETFDYYFMTFYEKECPFQTKKLLCSIKDSQEVDIDQLRETFKHRRLFLESCDLKPYHHFDQEFNDTLQKIVQKTMNLLHDHFKYSLDNPGEIYFCLKLLKQLDCFVVIVFQNDSQAKEVQVSYYYRFSVLCKLG